MFWKYLTTFTEYITPITEYITPIADYITPVTEYVTTFADYITPITDCVTTFTEYITPVTDCVTTFADYITPTINNLCFWLFDQTTNLYTYIRLRLTYVEEKSNIQINKAYLCGPNFVYPIYKPYNWRKLVVTDNPHEDIRIEVHYTYMNQDYIIVFPYPIEVKIPESALVLDNIESCDEIDTDIIIKYAGPTGDFHKSVFGCVMLKPHWILDKDMKPIVSKPIHVHTTLGDVIELN